jgi:hypothetical protein
MRAVVEKEKRLSPYLNAFLNVPRQHYFQEQLVDDLTNILRENKTLSFDDVVNSCEQVGTNFFYKFLNFLKTQEESIQVEDLCEISDAFIEIFAGRTFKMGQEIRAFDELLDWENFFEVMLLESSTMHLNHGNMGYEAVLDLARTAVSNDLEEENRRELIENYRHDVKSRITDLVGLHPELEEELQDRLVFYCDTVYPIACEEYNTPATFLGFCITEVKDLAREGFLDARSFLIHITEFEKAAQKSLMSYDSLLSRHAGALSGLLEEITGNPIGQTLPELKKAIINYAIEHFLNDQEQETESISGVYPQKPFSLN